MRYKKFLFFNVKDFLYNKYICDIYILAKNKMKFKTIKINIETKTTFEIFLKQKRYYFLILKILYLISISVKCIRRIYGLKKSVT